jgi:AhpD family alkylhydroperoxidase
MPLEERMKELIAVGASVTANCLGCVEFHVAKAREDGADEEEIKEAIRVGNKFDKFAQGLMKGDRPASTTCGGECA